MLYEVITDPFPDRPFGGKEPDVPDGELPLLQDPQHHVPYRARRTRNGDVIFFRGHFPCPFSRLAHNGFPHLVAHFRGSYPPNPGALAVDVARAVAVRERLSYNFV